MKLIVGLGNPGQKYQRNRHNVGFILLDDFAKENSLNWSMDKKAEAKVTKFEDIILAKPQTFMNRSGKSVSYLASYYNLGLENILVVHDDIDLDFGQTKLQKDSGSAGHLGVEDIIVVLKSKDFWRFRVGIGRPRTPPNEHPVEINDWVLSDFTPSELEKIHDISLPVGGL